MSTKIPQVRLPNGMKIFCIRKGEARRGYKDVQNYFKNGIQLHRGDTVFDVGANIGLFTLKASELCNKDVDIYAFEPIPAIHRVLYYNSQRIDPEKIKV